MLLFLELFYLFIDTLLEKVRVSCLSDDGHLPNPTLSARNIPRRRNACLGLRSSANSAKKTCTTTLSRYPYLQAMFSPQKLVETARLIGLTEGLEVAGFSAALTCSSTGPRIRPIWKDFRGMFILGLVEGDPHSHPRDL